MTSPSNIPQLQFSSQTNCTFSSPLILEKRRFCIEAAADGPITVGELNALWDAYQLELQRARAA